MLSYLDSQQSSILHIAATTKRTWIRVMPENLRELFVLGFANRVLSIFVNILS